MLTFHDPSFQPWDHLGIPHDSLELCYKLKYLFPLSSSEVVGLHKSCPYITCSPCPGIWSSDQKQLCKSPGSAPIWDMPVYIWNWIQYPEVDSHIAQTFTPNVCGFLVVYCINPILHLVPIICSSTLKHWFGWCMEPEESLRASCNQPNLESFE